MSNTINFSELKRKEIRRVILTNDADHGVEVYNPNKEQKKIILEMITANIDKETLKVKIDPMDVLLNLIPMLTNIQLDLDPKNDEDRKIIESVLEDSSELLLEVNEELEDIVKEISKHTVRHLKGLSELPKEKLDEVLKEIDETIKLKQETPEEKELRELEERMAKLKSKIGKEND